MVTAIAATTGYQQRPTTAHNARTIRANWGYVRPEKRKVVRRRGSAENLANALRARAPEMPPNGCHRALSIRLLLVVLVFDGPLREAARPEGCAR